MAEELDRPEEVERRVERDPGREDDELRKGAADQEEPEQHLDRAGKTDELDVADGETGRARDVEIDAFRVGEPARELGVRELLGERDDDQRGCGREAERLDRLSEPLL